MHSKQKMLFMKYKIGFRLEWMEMIFVLIMVFSAGYFVASAMHDKLIYVGLLVVSAGIILIKKRVKLPIKERKH
jgi:hypothetical protein